MIWNLTYQQVDHLLKWTATVLLIVGSFVNSMGLYPQGPCILLAGGLVWLWVSIRWREPSLIVTNAFMVIAGSIPLFFRYIA